LIMFFATGDTIEARRSLWHRFTPPLAPLTSPLALEVTAELTPPLALSTPALALASL
jgi:hypothetical protein